MSNRVDISAAIGQSVIAQLQCVDNRNFRILQSVIAEFEQPLAVNQIVQTNPELLFNKLSFFHI